MQMVLGDGRYSYCVFLIAGQTKQYFTWLCLSFPISWNLLTESLQTVNAHRINVIINIHCWNVWACNREVFRFVAVTRCKRDRSHGELLILLGYCASNDYRRQCVQSTPSRKLLNVNQANTGRAQNRSHGPCSVPWIGLLTVRPSWMRSLTLNLIPNIMMGLSFKPSSYLCPSPIGKCLDVRPSYRCETRIPSLSVISSCAWPPMQTSSLTRSSEDTVDGHRLYPGITTCSVHQPPCPPS